MAGRLGHIEERRRVGHVPVNGIRQTNYAYGFGGAVFWLDADYGTSTKTNNTVSSFWQNKLSNIKGEQPTASLQPIYFSSAVYFNNYPYIRFSPLRRYNLNSNIIIPDKFAFAMVVNVIGIQTTSNTLFNNISNNSDGFNLAYNASSLGPTILETAEYGVSTPSATTMIIVFTEDNIIINGVNQGSITPPSIKNITIMCGSVTARHGNCDLAEAVLYNQKFSVAQAIDLSDRINSKYAIY
jgi:hypothetical protein